MHPLHHQPCDTCVESPAPEDFSAWELAGEPGALSSDAAVASVATSISREFHVLVPLSHHAESDFLWTGKKNGAKLLR